MDNAACRLPDSDPLARRVAKLSGSSLYRAPRAPIYAENWPPPPGGQAMAAANGRPEWPAKPGPSYLVFRVSRSNLWASLNHGNCDQQRNIAHCRRSVDIIACGNQYSAEGARRMSEVTRILSQIEDGDAQAAEQLLPLVYDELRKLAAQKMAQEKPGQTLQATALVHEAYIRLVDVEKAQHWNSRGHFFAAAAEAMRRILVESARRKSKVRHGRDSQREELRDVPQSLGPEPETMLAVDEAVTRLAETDPVAADVVKLHFFAGMTLDETAEALGISRATTYRHWAYARALLRLALQDSDRDSRA